MIAQTGYIIDSTVIRLGNSTIRIKVGGIYLQIFHRTAVTDNAEQTFSVSVIIQADNTIIASVKLTVITVRSVNRLIIFYIRCIDIIFQRKIQFSIKIFIVFTIIYTAYSF